MAISKDDIERLKEILGEIKEHAAEALSIVRRSGNKLEYERAKSYWHPHIVMALDEDHSYVGSDTTLQECIDALEGDTDDEGDEDGGD